MQLEELTEQRTRAYVQGRHDDLAALDGEIAALQLELARTAEAALGVVDPPGAER